MTDPQNVPLPPPDVNADIDKLRRQAKQRFIGAAVLVLIAIVALPFVLDSKPRALSSNIAIDIPKMDRATATEPATALPPAPAASSPPLAFAKDTPAAQPEPPATAERPAATAPAPVAATTTTAPSIPTDSSVKKGQYIVQAGSFKENDKLQATMAKLDKAGIKHYTQAAHGKDGSPRTRLRLKGSFATREEANAAAAKVAKLGVAVIVLKP